ncbi:uncharacterized protein LOC127262911 [Andrographis paniculata]|uniref:uncharacterized protein LOC127262911 n=1 Tax=Andrographis paniculata TaxID=175694 RepID=UPI0021E87D69|nr:uncharacterized protein LOC127262911 [Andrographis paniculata]
MQWDRSWSWSRAGQGKAGGGGRDYEEVGVGHGHGDCLQDRATHEAPECTQQGVGISDAYYYCKKRIPKIVNLASARTDLFYQRSKKNGFKKSLTMISAQLLPSGSVTLSGGVYCYNSSLATAGTYSPITGATVNLDCQNPIPNAGSSASLFLNEGQFVYALSVAVVEQDNFEDNCHVEATMPPNSCNYNPPLRAQRYPIKPVKSNGRVVSYTLGAPIAIKA